MPLTTRPILGLELVHAKLEPVGVLAKLPIFIVEPGHTAIFVIEMIIGVG